MKGGSRRQRKAKKGWIALVLLLLGFLAGYLAFQSREDIGPRGKVLPLFGVAPRAARFTGPPKVAFVLDDWGYNLQALPLLKEIDRPLTLAILPNLPYSERIAEEAFAEGKEILLHLPMEPQRQLPAGKGRIDTAMSKAEIRQVLLLALGSVPYIRGVSNHQGSKATEDKRVMAAVMSSLKGTGYFYLDSMTTAGSVAEEAARRYAVPFCRRDVFLDNLMTEEAIQERIDELKSLAKQNGSAIGIGHDKTLTLEVIRRNLPLLEREGILVVGLSELLEDS